MAQLAFAGIVLIVLLFLTGPLQYLPHCVLASIVFTIAVGMVDVKGLKNVLQESRGEFLLAILTAVAVVGVGVKQGILFATSSRSSDTCATAMRRIRWCSFRMRAGVGSRRRRSSAQRPRRG